MALILNTNSYVSVAEADSYFETRIDSASWISNGDAVKEQALVTSTQILDNNAWIGSAVSSSQALAWPRANATYYDQRLGLEVTFAVDEVPQLMKTAVFEQALWLIENEDIMLQKNQTFESISIGSISLSDSNNDVRSTPIRSPQAGKLLIPLTRRGTTNAWWRAN